MCKQSLKVTRPASAGADKHVGLSRKISKRTRHTLPRSRAAFSCPFQGLKMRYSTAFRCRMPTRRFAAGQDAPHVERLQRDDIDGVVAQQFRELLLGAEALPVPTGTLTFRATSVVAGGIVMGHRVLVPGGVHRLQAVADVNGGRDAEPGVSFYGQVHPAANCLADRGDDAIERSSSARSIFLQATPKGSNFIAV